MRSFPWLVAIAVAAEDCQLADEGTMLQLDNRKILTAQAVSDTQADMGSTSATSDGASLEVHHPVIRGCYTAWARAVVNHPNFRLNDTSAGTSNVRCCSVDGSSCTSPGCHTDKTFAEAQQICDSEGMRLCTENEVLGNQCCGAGCGFDGELIWARPDEPVLLSGNCECAHCLSDRPCEDAFDGDMNSYASFTRNAFLEINFPRPVLVDHVDVQQHNTHYWQDFTLAPMNEDGWIEVRRNAGHYIRNEQIGSEGDGRDSIVFAPPIRVTKIRLSRPRTRDHRGGRQQWALQELQVYGWPLSA